MTFPVRGKNYVNGQWLDPNNALNPQKVFVAYAPHTQESYGTFPNTAQAAVNKAVFAAREAQKAWKKLSRVARAEYFDKLVEVMRRRKDDIVNAISVETGKNLNESFAEYNEAVHMAQYTFGQGREAFGRVVASEIADKDVSVFRKPKGVVAVIAPWNFPFAIGGFWTSAPALLEGNTVVFKPSEETPYCGQLIAELYHEAGFPAGTFNLVHGDGSTGSYLVHADVDHICFTGSAEVGRSIRRHCAETWNKSCSCEMGSKSAVVVFDDAPLDVAVKAAVASAFKLSGQRCVSAGRIMVQRSIFQKFAEAFAAEATNLKVGDPFKEPDSFFGPLINETQMKRVLEFNQKTLKVARTGPARTHILLEGKRLDRPGWFLSPHVYVCEWDDQYKAEDQNDFSFMRQEVFGPHVVLIPFNDVDDAVRIYNDTDYGLSMAVITTNMQIARHMRDNCDYGLGYHNLPSIGAESHIPFGGVKKSGYGGSSAAGSFAAVTHEVTWTANFQRDGFQFCQGMK